MCEFCHRHGEGEKWYLQAQNYSQDLLSDLNRRRFIEHFFKNPEMLEKSQEKLDYLNRLPSFVRSILTPFLLKRQKRNHYGQVVPLEDIQKILEMANSVVRLPCVCRKASLGTEERYCYGVSMVPPEEFKLGQVIRSIDADYLNGPEARGLETLTTGEALVQFRDLESKGLCHTVWTFLTPFIGGICNCDRSDCMAMQSTLKRSFSVMFRAEYVAGVNPELCNGCRKCMRACQFGAISYSAAREKAEVDLRRCYGCGICRSYCTNGAIVLNDRSASPIASRLW